MATIGAGEAKVALVTGAARGLGAHISAALAAAGYQIAGFDMRGAALANTLDAIAAQSGVETLAIVGDARDETQVEAAIERVHARFGHVDIFVSNAGIRELARIWELPTAVWERTLATNLSAAFLFTRGLLRRSMLKRNQGRLIYISSDAGKAGSSRGSAYCASKWGLRGFAASVAKDLTDSKIRVTTILPGMTETPMAQESEMWEFGYDWLDPDAVARAVVFCAEADCETHIPEIEMHHPSNV